MDNKFYDGNLSYDTTEDELLAVFAEAGTVSEVIVIKDRDTGRSKGFAFVTMASAAEANQAMQSINGRSLGNRELRVSIARPREESGGGGYDRNRGGGRGGFGGGGGGRDRDSRDRNRGGGNRRY